MLKCKPNKMLDINGAPILIPTYVFIEHALLSQIPLNHCRYRGINVLMNALMIEDPLEKWKKLVIPIAIALLILVVIVTTSSC